MSKALSKLIARSTRQITRMQSKAWKTAVKQVLGTPARKRPAKPRKASKTASPRKTAPAPKAARWLGTGSWVESRQYPAGAGFMLSYSLYQPRVAAGTVLPLVVMLHGCKLTAAEFAQGTRMNLLADREGFAVLYPQQSTTRNAARCWRWFQPTGMAGGREADAIASLIRHLLASGRYDPARVGVAGLSAGAGMSALVGLRHPDLVAAIALHSGPVVGAAHNTMGGLQTMRRGTLHEPIALLGAVAAPAAAVLGLPALLLHGGRDTAVDSRNQLQLAAQFCHLNGIDSSALQTRVVRAGTRGEHRVTEARRGGRPLVSVIEVPGLAHAWSGGDASVPYHGGAGPQASALIWRFFRAQRRKLPPG